MNDYTELKKLEHACDELKASFKNFHRSLCERFGYYHDEIDWQRDQVSLEEHIATQFNHVSAESGALRGQVEAVQRGAGQLQEENEALRKDAERYRWLRSRPVACPTNDPDLAGWEECSGEAIRGNDADAAIDAAMSKEFSHG